ncbi:hypothetical protein VNO77_23627 [Canavalia gladiata]|uniref:Uncharacterized protein n=1 Tax=Canavalia gladiata TaxID=3824 RepID=A0AAN9L841_CANGL
MEERALCENEMGVGMQCIQHPHRNNPAGICAYCLQDKLHKLLSSSFPPPSFTASPSPPPPPPLPPPLSLSVKNNATRVDLRPNIKNNKPSSLPPPPNIIFKRTKSTATPRNRFLNDEDFSPRKRHGFWSFLYLSSSKPSSSSSSSFSNKVESRNFSPRISTTKKTIVKKSEEEDENSTPNSDVSGFSYERKVSRSRSVGCGSRSFSGDFFDRISSGLGDCTLRRVESQREPNNKPKVNHCMKQRARCDGSASSTSSSSSYWFSSSADDRRGRSWGWAFATPIRAFAAKTF